MLRRFSDNYEFEKKDTLEDIVYNLKKIHALIPKKSLLVILLGSEFDYEGFKASGDVAKNKKLNAMIEREFANSENVRLINYTKFIRSKNDYDQSLGMVNHFSRRIYFDIAADMVKLANEYLKSLGSDKTVEVRSKTGIRTLIWTTNDFLDDIHKFYQKVEIRGLINVVGYAIADNARVTFYEKIGGKVIAPPMFQMVIVATENNFFEHLKMLKSSNVPEDLIVDGRIFQMPNLNFPRFYAERIVYGNIDGNEFSDESRMIYQRVCIVGGNIAVILGKGSYVKKISFIRENVLGELRIGNYTSILNNVTVKFCEKRAKYNVSTYDFENITQNKVVGILIGSDVKINSNVTLISDDADNPLVIGNGAIINDSAVVTKSVPPYAVVDGNPAQIVGYRFSQEIIDALQKIKWWDWNFDKIKKYFPYFSDIKKFISACNKGG